MKTLIAGDFCENNRLVSTIDKGDYSQIFGKIKGFVEKFDTRIVNFEFPIVDGVGEPIAKAGPSLKGHVKSVAAIKYAGFNVCTLANNHILDQGERCCLETKRQLNMAGVSTVGVGRTSQEASETLYIDGADGRLAIINCCEHEFSIASKQSAGANPLNPIQQHYKIKEARLKADFVVVIVHGGHEGCQFPSPRMKETYRFFVESGADAVINHHQHCYSGYEIYKGKPIFYGLGNFLFDWGGRQNEPWNYGYLVGLDFSGNHPSNVSFDLYPYVQCNDTPSVEFLDDEQNRRILKQIDELNTIIMDDALLEAEWSNWILQNSRYFLNSFQPYSTCLAQALLKRGLLPSFLSKKKRYSIIDHIECESHVDRLKLVLRNIKD